MCEDVHAQVTRDVNDGGCLHGHEDGVQRRLCARARTATGPSIELVLDAPTTVLCSISITLVCLWRQRLAVHHYFPGTLAPDGSIDDHLREQ